MSMYPQEMGTIPEETMRIAQAACPKGTLAMRLRDALAELYQDEHFAWSLKRVIPANAHS